MSGNFEFEHVIVGANSARYELVARLCERQDCRLAMVEAGR